MEAKKDGCIGSSHDAILKNPYKMGDIVNKAVQLFYHAGKGQYLYYFIDTEGKEWILITRRYGNTKFYELVTAFRRDCPLPKECKREDGDLKPVYSYLDVLDCEELYRVCSSFWKPHYLRETADLCEKAEDFDRVSEYTKEAVEEWERNKDSIDHNVYPIEEAWFNEEGGYIHEKASQFEVAMGYYKEAQSKYELAYMDEHVSSTEVTYAEFFSDWWSKYYNFFTRQIPDFRFIHFVHEYCKKNDFRRRKKEETRNSET